MELVRQWGTLELRHLKTLVLSEGFNFRFCSVKSICSKF